MLLVLARRGFVRAPTATAREFLGSLAERSPLFGPAAEITRLYERVRFGEEPLTSAEQARARSLLAELAGPPR
jgi:hypothetical protein